MMSTKPIDEALQTAVTAYRSGDLAKAEEICRQVINTEGDSGDAFHLLGLVHIGKGDYQAARDTLARAANIIPADADCQYNLAEACRCLGLLSEAVEGYEKAISLRPDSVTARLGLGLTLQELGLVDAAIRSYEGALLAAPCSIETLLNLGNALVEAGRPHEAILHLGRAVALDASCAEALRGLCRAFDAAQSFEAELADFMEGLQGCADESIVLERLAGALDEHGHTGTALGLYDRLCLIDACPASVHHHKGLLLARLGRTDEARAALTAAVRLGPERAEVHNDLGRLCYGQGLFEEAKEHFRRASDYGLPVAHAHLAAILAEEGFVHSAAREYDLAHSLAPRPGLKVLRATLLPVVAASIEETEAARTGMEQRIAGLLQEGLRIDDPVREIGKANFYLAYHGGDDKLIQQKLARFYRSICPGLSFVAPHCSTRVAAGDTGRLKVGFVSAHLGDHTVGRYMQGIIAHIDRDVFDVHLFPLKQGRSEVFALSGKDGDRVVELPEDLATARALVASSKLDILIYPDIGMEPFTYFMAFSRLAPVQCAFYGHPITTGIDTVDYFVSQADCETSESESHYSEKLITLSDRVAYTYYDRPPKPSGGRTRSDLSLSQSDHVYLCCQSLFKVHPDFDAILGGIVSRDSEAIILFFEGKHKSWAELLHRRLEKILGKGIETLRFLPRMAYGDYLDVISMADVVLDTVNFNGGATTFDAFACGTPVVTLPGRYMRGRQTYALYRRMGVLDCIAGSPAEYVDIAIRLAADKGLRDEVALRIRERNDLIFEDMGMVRELEGWLKRIAQTP